MLNCIGEDDAAANKFISYIRSKNRYGESSITWKNNYVLSINNHKLHTNVYRFIDGCA
jgi:hypothetical protein